MKRFLVVAGLSAALMGSVAQAQDFIGVETMGVETRVVAPLTAEAINGASLVDLVERLARPRIDMPNEGAPAAASADPAVVRLQVLLDQAGASPGVIDGYVGDNLTKAIAAFQMMYGLPVDGVLSPDIVTRLDAGQLVVGAYIVTAEDAAELSPPTPDDYFEKSQMDFLGYASVGERLAERFHMDEKFLTALNPGAQFVVGEQIFAVDTGLDRSGVVASIEADKTMRQVRAYDVNGELLAVYPATIGSTATPSPSGVHTVEAIAPMPNYTYNPEINFQQGDNTEVLTIPPGPNGPVGSMWIDLSAPTYGIHGTPEPSLIDKTASNGCIRLTNWDAGELAGMVAAGVVVTFI